MKKRRGSVGDGGYLCKALKSRGRKLNCLWKGGVCNVNDDAQRCGSVSLAGFTRYLLFIIHFLLLLSCHSLCWRWSTKSPRSHNLLSLVAPRPKWGCRCRKNLLGHCCLTFLSSSSSSSLSWLGFVEKVHIVPAAKEEGAPPATCKAQPPFDWTHDKSSNYYSECVSWDKRWAGTKYKYCVIVL